MLSDQVRDYEKRLGYEEKDTVDGFHPRLVILITDILG